MKDRAERPGEVRRGVSASNDPGGMAPTTVMAMIASAAVLLFLLRDVLLPFVLSGIVAYVLTPVITWLAQTMRLPRWIFALAVLALIMGIAAIVGFLGAPALFHEILAVGANLRGAVDSLARKFVGNGSFRLLGQTIDASSVAGYAVNGLRDWFNVSGRVFQLAIIGFAGFFGFILTWVLLGYFLIDAPRVGRGLFWLVPPRHRPMAVRIWSRLDPVLRRYFIGIALVVVYASIAAYVGLGLFLDLRHAVVLALVTGLLEIIPLIGPAASAIIAGLAAVQEAKSAWDIVTYIIYATALRISIDQFVGPIVLGRAAYVRPVLVIFCFLAGAILFGVVGMVLAVPVALTTKVILTTVYEDSSAKL